MNRLKKIINIFVPPAKWRLPVIILLAIFTGLLGYTVYISRAPSYLSDSPSTCVNCHIMAPQYASWSHSAHRMATNCNDCHVPHDNFFRKYFFKAKDGLRHATIFSLHAEPQVIFIKDAGKEVVRQNCIRCHERLAQEDKTIVCMQYGCSGEEEEEEEENENNPNRRYCWDCHRETPHGRVNGLSSAPNAQAPLPKSPVPGWLKNLMNKK